MAYASPDSRAYRSSNIRQSPAPVAQPSPRVQHFDDDDTISIADIIENLLDHKWPFLLVLLLATIQVQANVFHIIYKTHKFIVEFSAFFGNAQHVAFLIFLLPDAGHGS